VPYLSASAVVIHYEEAPYQVYAPLPPPAAATTTLCGGYNYDSTSIQLQFDHATTYFTTVSQPVAALRPK